MTPNEDGGFNIRGKILNANKKTRVYFASKGMSKLFRTAKVQTLNYNENEKTLEFDFYANVNDGDSKKDYNDEIYITARNGDEKKTIKIRMPKREVTKKEGTAPVIPDLHSIEDSATGKFNDKVRAKEENGKKRYFVRTFFKIADGYTIKLVCYNPGKNGLEAIEKAKYYSSDMSEEYVDIEILPGFNMLRMEVFKADKEKDVNENNIYESKGFCLYYDEDGPELDMKTSTFNPDKNGTLYIKKSPLVVEGVVGDKGGFNWHMRINESIVDEYLIYGDLTSDNHRPFRVEIPCEDKDVMDWNVKDYAGNSPDNFMAKHIIRIDNTKPEITIKPEVQGDDYNISGTDSRLGITITDKVDNGDKGSIMLKEVFVNGEPFETDKKLEEYTQKDGKYTIFVRAVDYAYNASVKTYIYDPNASENKIEEVENEELIVTVYRDNGETAKEFKVNKGEDFTLPAADFEMPEGKVFVGWDVEGTTMNPSKTIFVDKNTTVRAIYKNKEEKVFANIHFERNGGRGDMKDIKAEVGAAVKLPLNGFDSPSDKTFDCWMVKGEKKNPGDTIVVDGELTVTAIWKAEMRKPEVKPDVPFVPYTPEEGHDYFKPHRRINNKKDVTKEKKNENKTETAVVKDEGKKTTADVNTDYNSHWAKNAIVECFAKGIFNDFANKTVFMPEKPTTRAEFVTALGRLMNINPAEFNKNIFEDVDSNEFYAPFINWAASKKIVLGVDAKHFEPNKTLTREQMAAIIVRLFRTYGYKFNTNLMKPIYKDDQAISDWAKEEVYELTNIGVVQGNDDSTFNPKGFLKRGELAELVLKLTKKLEK